MVRSADVVVERLLKSRLGIKLRKAWSRLVAGYQPDPEKIIWIDPADVRRKVRESRTFPGPVLIGSEGWDHPDLQKL